MDVKPNMMMMTCNLTICYYSRLSLSRTRKGPENLFEIEKVRDREKIAKNDAALLVIPFSICRMILHFCISDTLFSFRLTADILITV